MTVARGPALLPGFYWIDAFHKGPTVPDFNTWLARNKGLVAVLNTSLHADETPPRDWVLFQVKLPTVWLPADAALWGFPTVAPHGAATTEEDSRDNADSTPSPGGLGDILSQLFAGSGSLSGVAVLAALAWASGLFGGRSRR